MEIFGDDFRSNVGERGDDQNEGEYFGEYEDEIGGREILPLAAFASAFASAALLSPQGLVSGSVEQTYSPVSAVGLFLVGLGGMALLAGIGELGDDDERLEERERKESVLRDEMMLMGEWDDELEGKSSRD